MLKVLITGSNGFVGSNLVKYLEPSGCEVVRIYRQVPDALKKEKNYFSVGDINEHTQWKNALKGVDCVVHLAARVHVMKENVADPLAAFRSVNTDGTLNLARQAVEAGVKRFVYLSSIKVNGEQTGSIPFSETDHAAPQEPYAQSKYEAEQHLLDLSKQTGLEIVIIRPPLVYGPGVKGNFSTMMSWIAKGIPLPFGAINNKRSLLALDNLVSFIDCCIMHPVAANEIFLISDGEDVSTTELLQKVAKAMGLKITLVPVPVSWMRFTAKLLGKQAVADRLFASLQVDSTKAQKLLGWQPVISMNGQLKKMALN